MAHSRNKRGQQIRSRRCIATRRTNAYGGTIINVIVAVVFFGLIALGIWWLMKSIGQTGQQYTEAMVRTRYNALTVKCQTNMRTIGQNIQMYAITNETLPPSSEALEQWSGSSQLFRCPDPNGGKYTGKTAENRHEESAVPFLAGRLLDQGVHRVGFSHWHVTVERPDELPHSRK